MKHREGMRVSLIDEGLLDSTGILQGNSGCTNAYGLPDASVQLFLLVAAAGDGGLPRSHIPKELQPDLSEHLVPLELQELVTWERDNRGRLSYLVLTWKGGDAIAAARPRRRDPTQTWKARRAAVNGVE